MSLPALPQRNTTEEPSGLVALSATPSVSVYDEYYQFIEPPFGLTPNTRFFFWGGAHAHVLEQVMVALRAREGVVLVTGATGTGKTMLCWVVAHHVRSNALLSMFVNPTLGPDDLLKQILEDFGAVAPDRPITETGYALFRMLEQFLVERIGQGDRAVILIDEAHQLRPDVIEQIRLLSNLESEHAKLLQIVLIGLPEIEETLRRPECQQFDQRVSRRCELLPLTPAEVGRYIDRRLAIAQAFNADAAGDPSPVQPVLSGDVSEGSQRVEFTPDALAEIAARAHGIPRQINLLADRALEVGHEREARSIDRALVLSAASRLKLPHARPSWRPDARVAVASAAVVFVAAAAAATGWWVARESRQAQPPRQAEVRPAAAVRATPTGPTAPTTAARQTAPAVPGAASTPAARTLETAPSVLIAAVSFETPERADEVVKGLQGLGLPAFSRDAPASRWHQVMVGPYASVDEARAAERQFPTLRITEPAIVQIGRSGRPAKAGSLVLLEVEDRASLLVESPDAGIQASRESASDTTLVVDVGPFTAPVQPEERDGTADMSLVSHVSVSEAAKPGTGHYMRMRVTLRAPSHSQARVAGRRVYLDFAPLAPAAHPSGLIETVVEKSDEPVRSESTTALPPVPIVAAQILRRGTELATKNDVRGLEQLHADVLKRAGAADQQPDDIRRALDEVERYTRDARTARLQEDARVFQKVEDDRYRAAMRPILAGLDRLRNATSPQLLAPTQNQLRAVTVPPGMAATHKRVQDALALMTDALVHPADDAARKIAEATALLDWARADVTGRP